MWKSTCCCTWCEENVLLSDAEHELIRPHANLPHVHLKTCQVWLTCEVLLKAAVGFANKHVAYVTLSHLCFCINAQIYRWHGSPDGSWIMFRPQSNRSRFRLEPNLEPYTVWARLFWLLLSDQTNRTKGGQEPSSRWVRPKHVAVKTLTKYQHVEGKCQPEPSGVALQQPRDIDLNVSIWLLKSKGFGELFFPVN